MLPSYLIEKKNSLFLSFFLYIINHFLRVVLKSSYHFSQKRDRLSTNNNFFSFLFLKDLIIIQEMQINISQNRFYTKKIRKESLLEKSFLSVLNKYILDMYTISTQYY